MRAVIIGTDFMKDTDGTFKALETNTNINLEIPVSYYSESTELVDFLSNNSIEEVHIIFNRDNIQIQGNVMIPENVLSTPTNNFINFLSSSISTYNSENESINCTLTEHEVDKNSITIPMVEDSENKLIIRLAYDTTALIDDIYARDNWEFLRLLYDIDPNLIPKCYINDDELGINNIGETLRDNGNHPNYCIKKRVTPSDNKVYPILYKISTLEELETIKSNLEVDEYIQEYIFDDSNLLDDRIQFIRSVDMVYGPDLNKLNIATYQKSTLLELTSNCDYTDDVVEVWDRPKYLPKYQNSTSETSVRIDADSNTKILLSDNTIKTALDLNVGDIVTSFDFPSLNDVSESQFGNWKTPVNEFISSSIMTTASVNEKSSFEYFGKIVNIQLENGALFSDVPHATIFKVENEFELVNLTIEDKNNFILSVSGSNFYFDEVGLNPHITLYRGETYTFDMSELNHPFYIKTTNELNTNDLYSNGLTTQNNITTFTVPLTAPNVLYYTDGNDSNFSGNIKIGNPKEVIESRIVKFAYYDSLNINDNIIIIDRNTNQLIEEKVTNIYYTLDKLTAYRIDVNDPDLFFTLNESNDNRYGIITHNYDFDCVSYSCHSGGYVEGYDCGGGWYFDCSSSNQGACIRVGAWYGGFRDYCFTASYTWQGNNYSCGVTGPITFNGYCNGNKSDRRLKKNINFLYENENGIKIYEFEFIDEIIEINEELRGIWHGVIAQELIDTKFEFAVRLEDDGYFAVDYDKLQIELKKKI